MTKAQDYSKRRYVFTCMFAFTISILVSQYYTNGLLAIPVFVGDDGKPCEFNCEKEWINDTNNLKVIKDRQKSPKDTKEEKKSKKQLKSDKPKPTKSR